MLLRQLVGGLGRRPVGSRRSSRRRRPDPEFVVAEDVGIVRGGEVGGQFVDLGVDGLTDGSGEVIDFSLLLGW